MRLLEELQYTDDNVVDVAKPWRLQKQQKSAQHSDEQKTAAWDKILSEAEWLYSHLKFLGVMQTSSPVDGDVADLE